MLSYLVTCVLFGPFTLSFMDFVESAPAKTLLPCSVECGLSYADSFVGLDPSSPSDNLTLNLMHFFTVRPQPTTVKSLIFCSNFASYNRCLSNCHDSVNGLFRSSLAGLDLICNADKQGNGVDLNDASCLLDNYSSVLEKCSNALRDFNATATLTSAIRQCSETAVPSQFTNDVLNRLQQYCQSATGQISCLLPAARQICGSSASAIIENGLFMSLKPVKQLADKSRLAADIPVSCQQLFSSLSGLNDDDAQNSMSKSEKVTPTAASTTVGASVPVDRVLVSAKVKNSGSSALSVPPSSSYAALFALLLTYITQAATF